MSLHSKNKIVVHTIIIGKLTCILISYPLWFPVNRSFPIVPIFESLDLLPLWVHYTLTIAIVIILLLCSFWNTKRKTLLAILLVVIFSSLLLDQLRWQPWVYHFSWMLLAFIIYRPNEEQKIFNWIGLILALIYIWSGIQKLNASFIQINFPWMLEPFFVPETDSGLRILYILGAGATLLELGLGAGLLIKKTQRASAYLLIVMHILIIVVVSPLGHSTNYAIIPWNICFSVLIWFLFIKPKKTSFDLMRTIKSFHHVKLVILFFGLLPILSIWGYWPKFFSAALYSGNTVSGELYFSDQFLSTLPEEVREKANPGNNGLTLNQWTTKEITTAIYPSKEYMVKVFKKLCERAENEFDVIFTIHETPASFSVTKNKEDFFCTDPDL